MLVAGRRPAPLFAPLRIRDHIIFLPFQKKVGRLKRGKVKSAGESRYFFRIPCKIQFSRRQFVFSIKLPRSDLRRKFVVPGHDALNGVAENLEGNEMRRPIQLSIADPAHPIEVSRLKLSDRYMPHWTGWDPVTRRLVVDSSETPEERLYLLQLDEKTGALSLDQSFRDTDGQPGFNFNEREWPHGWRGAARPHGAVFTR